MMNSTQLFEKPRLVGIKNPGTVAQCRSHYTHLIESLLAADEKELAYECAAMAVRHGVWNDPLQRPELHFVPQAPALPIHDKQRFWFSEFLEERYQEIRQEIDGVTDPSQWGIFPVEQDILDRGRWEQVVFFDQGIRFDRACDLFPKTAAALEAIQQKTTMPGLVSLLWLYPGSNVVPHCGHTNSRLRVHLGIDIPKGAGIRVGKKVLQWQEGKCLVFDDSFEHEVWNYGKTPRIVLLFDIFNPDVPEAEKAEEDRQTRSFTEKVGAFMTESHLQKVAIKGDRIDVTLDPATEKTVRRYLANSNIKAVSMENGNLAVERS